MDPTTEQARRSRLIAIVPALVFATLLIVMVRHAARPMSDPDLWWHLRVGELFREGTFSLSNPGALSSFATEDWIPRDWLPQIVASTMEARFGLPGIAWLYGATLIALLAALYFATRRQSTALIASLSTTLGIIAISGSLTERPQLVSFILLAVTTDAWLRTSVDYKARWWLVPLSWFWACSHGLWYVGIAIGIVVVACLPFGKRVPPRVWFRLAAIPNLSLLATALTPAGPELLLAAFQTGDKWRFVTEWEPPNFATLAPAAAMLIVCTIAVAFARFDAVTPWVSIGLLLLGTALVLMSARTVAAGAIILAPLLAATLQKGIYGAKPADMRTLERSAVLSSGALTLLALMLVTPITSSQAGKVPTAFDTRLEALPDGTSILNDYSLGGWLHWRHPQLNTVIDGFTDGYTVDALENYANAVRVQPGWETYVDESGVSVALLREDSSLALALRDRLSWVAVTADAGYIYLSSPPKESASDDG